MALDDRRIWAEIHRDQPSAISDNNWGAIRGTRFGEVGVQSFSKGKYAIADEGAYFMATNPTPGTGVAGIAAADGNNDAENLVHINNEASEASGKRVYLDYLRLYTTAAGTNGTNVSWVHKIDSADRYTSGGSEITPVNVNMDDTTAASAEVYFGALVTATASSQRLLGGGLLRSVIGVVGDVYTFDFGAPLGLSGSHALAGTAIAHIYVPCCPVILGSGDSWMFQINAASQTVAKSFEFELGFWER